MSLIEEKTLADHDINVRSIRQEFQLLEEQLKKHGRNEPSQSLIVQPDTDTISRKQAIDEIRNTFRVMYSSDMISKDDAVDILNELPPSTSRQPDLDTVSRQTEPHWIPCSERLPEDGTDCLVSVRCSKKVVVVDIATYSTDLFKVDKEDFFGNRGESGWYYLNREYGYCKVLNVIAWMPLPECYRESEG